jgi:hypothetical protein
MFVRQRSNYGLMICGGLHPSMLLQSSTAFGGSTQPSMFLQSWATHMQEPFDWTTGEYPGPHVVPLQEPVAS